jgi:hypothetical protein
MAKDIALLEAYESIYEAGQVTGVVATPGSAGDQQPVANQGSTTTTPVQFQAADSTKLIKNLNDTFLKTRENTDILVRHSVPQAKEQFAAQKVLIGQTINSIIASTKDGSAANVYKSLTSGLDRDLVSLLQPQAQQATPIKAVAKQ